MSLTGLLGVLGAFALAFGGPHAGIGIEASAGMSAATAAAEAGASGQPKTSAATGPVRYRPVGCAESGPAMAHTHGPARKVVALSFDDGPAPLTLRFVRLLRAQKAVGTFFMLGDQLSGRYVKLLHEELRDGDALGDHSWSHPDLAARGDVRSQLQRTKSAIGALSGYLPCVFRPPYGAFNRSVLQAASSLGLATITWNVDPRDWALPGVATIEARVLSEVTPGSIILSHDGGGPRGQTLAAYPSIIASLRRRGYRFETVPQLLGFRGIYRRCRLQCGEAAIEGRPPAGSIVVPG